MFCEEVFSFALKGFFMEKNAWRLQQRVLPKEA
jgi:hypothetical protein